ncbi:hypothetical protein TNCV_4125731 [Trichonephila clavipes]|nr:hypothetical protein TNCV_4125731 [Trichonephila clavipes]
MEIEKSPIHRMCHRGPHSSQFTLGNSTPSLGKLVGSISAMNSLIRNLHDSKTALIRELRYRKSIAKGGLNRILPGHTKSDSTPSLSRYKPLVSHDHSPPNPFDISPPTAYGGNLSGIIFVAAGGYNSAFRVIRVTFACSKMDITLRKCSKIIALNEHTSITVRERAQRQLLRLRAKTAWLGDENDWILQPASLTVRSGTSMDTRGESETYKKDGTDKDYTTNTQRFNIS